MSLLVSYLPFLMATAGLAVVVARNRLQSRLAAVLAPYSDVVWCGVLLMAKTSLLYAQLDGHNEPRVPWLDLALAATALALLLLVKYAIRIWLVFATAVTTSIWIWGDLIHYRFFKDVASAAALQAAGNPYSVFRQPSPSWCSSASQLPGSFTMGGCSPLLRTLARPTSFATAGWWPSTA